MNIFTQLYEFMCTPAGTFDSDSSPCAVNSDNDTSFGFESTIINPANNMPMIDGIGGFDITGSPYGMDLMHHNEPNGIDHTSMFSNNDCDSMFDHSTSSSDACSMFDHGSSFDSTSMFDHGASSFDNASMFD